MQERRNSIANALELRLFFTNQSMCWCPFRCMPLDISFRQTDISYVSRSWAMKYDAGLVFRGSHTILHGKVRSVGQCQAVCVSTPGCISFITTPSSFGGYVCEINDDEDTSLALDINGSCYLFEPYWLSIQVCKLPRWFKHVSSRVITLFLSNHHRTYTHI